MSHGPYSTPGEYALLDRLAAAGLSNREIARRMGRSITWVWTKLRWPGARTPTKGQPRAPANIERKPWKPGDPKPEWLRRGR